MAPTLGSSESIDQPACLVGYRDLQAVLMFCKFQPLKNSCLQFSCVCTFSSRAPSTDWSVGLSFFAIAYVSFEPNTAIDSQHL